MRGGRGASARGRHLSLAIWFPEEVPRKPSFRTSPCARPKDLLSPRADIGRTAIEVQPPPGVLGEVGEVFEPGGGAPRLPKHTKLPPRAGPGFSPLRTQFVRGGAGGGASRGRSSKPGRTGTEVQP